MLTKAKQYYIIIHDTQSFFKRKFNMKKIVIASLVALIATTASAWELGVDTSRSFAGKDNDSVGITLGKSFAGGVGLTAGFARDASKTSSQDRYSVVGSYDIVKFGGSTLSAKAGGVFMANSDVANGSALVAGVGLSVPLTKTVAATFDVSRQYGQDRVSQFDGNRATIGLKYTF